MVVCSALPSSAKSCLGSISLVWVPLHSNQAQHHLPIKQEKQLSCTSSPALSGFFAQGKGEREPEDDIVKGLQGHHGWPYINQAAIKLSNLLPSPTQKDLGRESSNPEISCLTLKKVKIKSYTPPLHLTIVSRLCMRAYVVLWIQVVDC